MPRIDAEHRGPLINIAAWFLLVTMILFTASKVVTKWRMVRRLQNDDYLILLAMLTATGQCVAASEQAQHGLGQVRTSLSASDFDRFQKASYIDEIFYIFTIYLSKLAALQFLVILARPNEQSLRRVTVRGTVGFIILWLFIAFVCIAFQCKIPTPWNYDSGQCFNQLAFWSVNAAIDVITTTMIGLMPIYLLYNLQLPKDNKRLAMLSFTPNLTTIPLTVLRIIYLTQAFHSPDTTKASFNVELVTVIQTNYSVIASCLPFLKPFLDSLAIGLMTNDIRIPMNNDNKTTAKDGRMNPFAILGGGKSYAQRTGYGSWTRSIINTGKGSKVNEQEHELRDLERYGSRERMVINQTRTAEVTSEPRTLEPGQPQVPESSVPPPSSVLISAGGPIPKPGYGP